MRAVCSTYFIFAKLQTLRMPFGTFLITPSFSVLPSSALHIKLPEFVVRLE